MGKPVSQNHHDTYDPEVQGTLHKGEHYILTQIRRRTNHSAYFGWCLVMEGLRTLGSVQGLLNLDYRVHRKNKRGNNGS